MKSIKILFFFHKKHKSFLISFQSFFNSSYLANMTDVLVSVCPFQIVVQNFSTQDVSHNTQHLQIQQIYLFLCFVIYSLQANQCITLSKVKFHQRRLSPMLLLLLVICSKVFPCKNISWNFPNNLSAFCTETRSLLYFEESENFFIFSKDFQSLCFWRRRMRNDGKSFTWCT